MDLPLDGVVDETQFWIDKLLQLSKPEKIDHCWGHDWLFFVSVCQAFISLEAFFKTVQLN